MSYIFGFYYFIFINWRQQLRELWRKAGAIVVVVSRMKLRTASFI